MNWTATTRTIDLGYEQLLTFQGRPGTRIRVLYGAMWLTEEGDLRDFFARCGDEVTLSSSGRSVIEGIGPARVEVIEPRQPSRVAAITRRLAHVWEAMWSRKPRDVFARSVMMLLAIVVSVTVLHIAVPGPLARTDTTVPAQEVAATDAAIGVLADVANAKTAFLTVN